MFKLINITTFFILLSGLIKIQANPLFENEAPNQSVLSSGTWIRFGVTSNGIYKIDYDYLQKAGINVGSIDPRNIKIYGNGGKMLPQSNNTPRPIDLTENAIRVIGEGDGKFDKGDYILFYGQTPDTYHYDQGISKFIYEKNIYSDTAYYFLTIGNTRGKRITNQNNSGTSFTQISHFDDFLIHEQDLENLLSNVEHSQGAGSGRLWLGERFDNFNSNRTFSFQIPGLRSNVPLNLTSSVVTRESFGPSSFTLEIGNKSIGTQTFSALSDGRYNIKGAMNTETFSVPFNDIPSPRNQISIKLTFNRSFNHRSLGYLNYLLIHCQRNLQVYGNQTIFRSIASLNHANSTFVIDNASSSLNIWDITNPLEPRSQQFNLSDGKARFGTNTTSLKEFVAFTGASFPSPGAPRSVSNQNLRGITSIPDMVIVAHPLFRNEAQRLASFRQKHSKLDVLVVTTNQVYNEFSSGAQDISAIRDFMKFLYDKNEQNPKLKYLLLFGRCSFDYKNRVRNNTNFVPTYQSRESFHPIFSYSSDDYFGFLDNEEGEWIETTNGDHELNIGVGRFPVRDLEEAKAIVDKTIHYHTAVGSWKNNIVFVADEGDGNLHQKDADLLAEFIDTTYAQYNVQKIYLDAYPQITTPRGHQAPAVNQAINQAIDKGSFIVNFTGHGSINGWTSKEVLNKSMIASWRNRDKLPLFITATCEFGRYDTPGQFSAGEQLLTTPLGGGIAIVTTTRPVFSSSNYLLNEAFYKHVFEQEDNRYATLGEVFKKTKNNSLSGSINRNFSLLGDPSLVLAYPKENIILQKVNDSPIDEQNDTLKALSKIKLKGYIVSPFDEKKITSFNGILDVIVYDKADEFETLGNHGPVMTFKQRDNRLFNGKVSVKGGEFTFEFVVPKNIDYSLGQGKISMYAVTHDQTSDASGSCLRLPIGGSDENAKMDSAPPKIKLFLNDTTFVNGGVTGSSPLLLAKLSDESGINITNRGIGQGIIAYISQNKVISLNEHYTTKLDSYTTGWVTYPLQDLPEGNHSIRLKAWDTHNNSSEAVLDFIVTNDAKLALNRVFNFPNPLSNHTSFVIEHSRAGESLEVQILIYAQTGEIVKKISGIFDNSNYRIEDINWDGRNESGGKIQKGVYIYKVIVRSLLDGAKNQSVQKLVIIN
jgi:hypothetical protein